MSKNEDLIRDLCNLEIPSSIKFSPDGRDVLYSTELSFGHAKGATPVSTLWLATAGQPNSSRQLTSGLYKDYAPAWSPDGKSVAFISDRAKAGEKWAIYILPLKVGGEPYPITPVENERGIVSCEFSPDGKSIAFISADEKTAELKALEKDGVNVNVWGEQLAYGRLRTVDVQTKKITNVLNLDRDVFSCCWSPDGEQIAILTFPTPEIEPSYITGSVISTVDARTLTKRDVCAFPKRILHMKWAKNEKIHFVSYTPPENETGGQAVYAINLNSKSLNYKRVAFGIENDADKISSVNGKIVVKIEHGLESRVCLLDGTVLYGKKEELEAFDATTSPGSNEILLAVATSNTDHPVEVFTTSSGGSPMVQLSSHGASFANRKFGSCSFLSCSSADEDVEFDSIYLTPAKNGSGIDNEPPKAPLPTVVLIHGGPNARFTNAFNVYYFVWSTYLLHLGYGVLLPNYRGSKGRGEKFAIADVGGLGVRDYGDVITATQHAVKLGYADKDRLVVGGYSHGGYLTFCSSVYNGQHDYGWKFKAAIAGAGISDTDSMTLTSDIGSIYPAGYNERRLPWNLARNDTRNRTASPLWGFQEAVDKAKKKGEMGIPPILILHGEQDLRCPVSQAWGMRRALESQGLPFKLVTYPGQGHIISKQKYWIDMALRLGEWCEKYIGPGT